MRRPGPRGPSRRDDDGLSRPFLKSLSDIYDFLVLGVVANAVGLLMLALAASSALVVKHGPTLAPLAVSATALILVGPAVAWGLASLGLAIARREDPGLGLLFCGFGRAYPRAFAYGALTTAGFGIIGFMVLFWSAAPVTGAAWEQPIAGLWVALGLAMAPVAGLGWCVLVLSKGKPVYSLRVALALSAASPRWLGGYSLSLVLVAVVLSFPLVSQWQGIAVGVSVMFLAFGCLFTVSVLTANYCLSMLAALEERKEALDRLSKSHGSEEDTPNG